MDPPSRTRFEHHLFQDTNPLQQPEKIPVWSSCKASAELVSLQGWGGLISRLQSKRNCSQLQSKREHALELSATSGRGTCTCKGTCRGRARGNAYTQEFLISASSRTFNTAFLGHKLHRKGTPPPRPHASRYSSAGNVPHPKVRCCTFWVSILCKQFVAATIIRRKLSGKILRTTQGEFPSFPS